MCRVSTFCRYVAILCIAANLFGLEHYFGPDRPALLNRVAVGALFASLCVFFSSYPRSLVLTM